MVHCDLLVRDCENSKNREVNTGLETIKVKICFNMCSECLNFVHNESKCLLLYYYNVFDDPAVCQVDSYRYLVLL